MDRLACVDFPALPLQLLLARHPGWRSLPAAVVDRDKPQGLILWANHEARRRGVLPGMRYNAGLALASDLRAGEIPTAEIDRGVVRLADRLRRFSPEVEPAAEQPGTFWLNATGLQPLYASLKKWAAELRRDMRQVGFQCSVVVGFTRFGTYAAARQARGREASVFRSAPEELEQTRRTPLEALDIDPKLRDTLGRLGIRTVGEFLRLPPSGIRARYGSEAHRLHRLAAGELTLPLQPEPIEEPLVRGEELEPPETDLHRLLFAVKRQLDRLLDTLAERQQALTEIRIRLALDLLDRTGARERIERIRTAAPTLDAAQIMNLVHLRLMDGELAAGVVELSLAVRPAHATPEQLLIFREQRRRDLEAADRAVARVRAQFGDRAVVRARLKERHLPEASFSWEPVERVQYPAPARTEAGFLVRRIHSRPLRLPPRPRSEPDGWLLRGFEHGHVVHFSGPYAVSGGWWARTVHRDYYFARTRDDECVWIYYDRRRRRWYLQGEIE